MKLNIICNNNNIVIGIYLRKCPLNTNLDIIASNSLASKVFSF